MSLNQIPEFDAGAIETVRQYVEAATGIVVGKGKEYLVKNRLQPLLRQEDCSNVVSLIMKAKTTGGKRLRDKIIDAFTTNETLWFRDAHPFRLLEEYCLPTMIKRSGKGSTLPLNIWCAACSTGQEPYSIAITILEAARKNLSIVPNKIRILGTDISPSALFTAMNARYDDFSMGRGMPLEYRDRYFKKEEKSWKLVQKVRDMVQFQPLNLQDSLQTIGHPDIIFCRNVAIYFSRDFKVDLFSRIRKILQPEGCLIIGASESLLDVPNLFCNHREKQATFYRALPKGAFS